MVRIKSAPTDVTGSIWILAPIATPKCRSTFDFTLSYCTLTDRLYIYPMSEKGDNGKTTRDERLAENLRANLKRRKQAARKAKKVTSKVETENNQNPDKPSP